MTEVSDLNEQELEELISDLADRRKQFDEDSAEYKMIVAPACRHSSRRLPRRPHPGRIRLLGLIVLPRLPATPAAP